MKTVAIVQARLGSTRLPRKVLADVAGQPILFHVLDRARRIIGVDEVILATTVLGDDEILLQLAHKWGVPSYVGSSDDVLERYYGVAKRVKADVIVRVTADCPMLDSSVSSQVIKRFSVGDADYVSNAHPPTYPDGLDTEVFSFASLEQAWREARLDSEREHVTAYIWNHPELFRLANVEHLANLSYLRWTVDEPCDLEFVRSIYARLYQPNQIPFAMPDVLNLLECEPNLLKGNTDIVRNEGYLKSLHSDAKIKGL